MNFVFVPLIRDDIGYSKQLIGIDDLIPHRSCRSSWGNLVDLSLSRNVASQISNSTRLFQSYLPSYFSSISIPLIYIYIYFLLLIILIYCSKVCPYVSTGIVYNYRPIALTWTDSETH